MSRTQIRVPGRERTLAPIRRLCPGCGGRMRIRYENQRTLVTLSSTVRLRLKIRRCEAAGCARFHKPYRPEAESALALPQHEFGLDIVALVGALRHREHRAVQEIHALLRGRGVAIAERSVTNLLDRYEEVLATQLGALTHLRRQLAGQDRVILALDGLAATGCGVARIAPHAMGSSIQTGISCRRAAGASTSVQRAAVPAARPITS